MAAIGQYHFLAVGGKSSSLLLIRVDERAPEWVLTLEKNIPCPRTGFFEAFVTKQKKKGHVVGDLVYSFVA
jgi:hypothetical protein